ncbi:hypothetical protein AC578_7063 [Pseudocercospora eumusae]|uniref:Uncharacterized protein n=1 Tax=Pseudocercospora eumusae TaxID=321146 RepID=A0A139HFM2_9PEZI|nr:hypothetical protein AC578_7063 [Pseudocercospora eumusae]
MPCFAAVKPAPFVTINVQILAFPASSFAPTQVKPIASSTMQRQPHYQPHSSHPRRQSLHQNRRLDDIVAEALNQHAERKFWSNFNDFPTSWREVRLTFWQTCHRVDGIRRSWPVRMLFAGIQILLIFLLFCFVLVKVIVVAHGSFIFSRMVRRPEFDFCTTLRNFSTHLDKHPSVLSGSNASELSVYHHIDPNQLLSHSFKHFATLNQLAPNISITLDLTNRATIDIEAIHLDMTTRKSDPSLNSHVSDLKTKLNAQQSLLSTFTPSLISHLTDARHRTTSLRRTATSQLRKNSHLSEWTRTIARIFLTTFPSLYPFTDEGQLESRLENFLGTFLSDLRPLHANSSTLYLQAREILSLALFLQQQKPGSSACLPPAPPPPSFFFLFFFFFSSPSLPPPPPPPCLLYPKLYDEISQAKATLEALWHLHQEIWTGLESLVQQGEREARGGAKILARRFVVGIDREGSLGAAERLGDLIARVLG